MIIISIVRIGIITFVIVVSMCAISINITVILKLRAAMPHAPPPRLKIHQRGVQWKQGVVIDMMLYTSLLYNTTPIHCTPLPLHHHVMNTHRRRLLRALRRRRRLPGQPRFFVCCSIGVYRYVLLSFACCLVCLLMLVYMLAHGLCWFIPGRAASGVQRPLRQKARWQIQP